MESTKDFTPRYLKLSKVELKERIKEALSLLEECVLCPRECLVRRLEDEDKGFCRSGRQAIVSSYGPHFGEELPLVGSRGSGTIFFTYCNLKCIFCQNFEISHLGEGNKVDSHKLAEIMIYLQNIGCHNINLVTPTHFVPQILEALDLAIEEGLRLPLVYNCGGYEKQETLKILEGIIDIYMPDIKYLNKETAKKLSNAEDYPEVVKSAIKEMHRQVGDLKCNEDGIAEQGLLIRHLVLPHNLADTKEVMEFLAKEISTESYVNIMDQYRPCYRAGEFKLINRRITPSEYEEAIQIALKAGIKRLDERKPLIFRLI